jgi:molecular chaperone GrpE
VNSDATKTDNAQAADSANDGDAPASEASADELQSRLRETEAQQLRLAADFANFRKRARQEQSDITKRAARSLAGRLLPVLDGLERALRTAPAGVDQNWLRGIQLTFHRLRDELASVGVEPIEAVGSRFDPRLHEAVGSEESTDHPEGTVVDELRRGYRIQDDVLRPSLVRITRRPAEDGARADAPQPRRSSHGSG